MAHKWYGRAKVTKKKYSNVIALACLLDNITVYCLLRICVVARRSRLKLMAARGQEQVLHSDMVSFLLFSVGQACSPQAQGCARQDQVLQVQGLRQAVQILRNSSFIVAFI
jgi:hypothetical protein